MLRILHALFALLLFNGNTHAQENVNSNNFCRETPIKINDLVHTKLNLRFDYKKRSMYGQEWIKLKPHTYPLNKLILDAKGLEILQVGIVKNNTSTPLTFDYDHRLLEIELDRVYQHDEYYTIFIEYIVKSHDKINEESTAIGENKGLYFINPDGTDKNKPVQIWTQSALENASTWFPTIDKPNQKATSEISLTIPDKYVTLSNGTLVSQTKCVGNMRTDTWKMKQPHSPYLFMFAVGDFKKIIDKWQDKEVSYYLEPKYAPYARNIFGHTPEMITYFSKILGVNYPWDKYSQIVVRDYQSGGMENTTATLLTDRIHATPKEMKDFYFSQGESTIAHELFHQWFGDYVTCESWSDITLNESFADLAETLWAEKKYGRDTGDDHNNRALQDYLLDTGSHRNALVRYNYHKNEDVFDVISYQKGGRILNMLRHYLGDRVFCKGLNTYLTTNAFKNAEVAQLRLAMEEVSGQDLNWFFAQWYFSPAHPILDINYKWDEQLKTQTVYIKQLQNGAAFFLPLTIDIYNDGKVIRYNKRICSKSDTLIFKLRKCPNLVNVDAEKILLAKKIDHKTFEQFLFQYRKAPLYMDRYESIDAAVFDVNNSDAQKILTEGLHDKYYGLRIMALNSIPVNHSNFSERTFPAVISLANSDRNTLVRAAAIKCIGRSSKARQYISFFKQTLKNESYEIAAAALTVLKELLPNEILSLARSVEKGCGGELREVILRIYKNYDK